MTEKCGKPFQDILRTDSRRGRTNYCHYALTPTWEQKIRESLKGDLLQGWQLQMDPKVLNFFVSQVSKAVERMAMEGKLPVLLVHPDVRFIVRKIVESKLPNVHVLSYSEIEPGTKVRSLGMVE